MSTQIISQNDFILAPGAYVKAQKEEDTMTIDEIEAWLRELYRLLP